VLLEEVEEEVEEGGGGGGELLVLCVVLDGGGGASFVEVGVGVGLGEVAGAPSSNHHDTCISPTPKSPPGARLSKTPFEPSMWLASQPMHSS